MALSQVIFKAKKTPCTGCFSNWASPEFVKYSQWLIRLKTQNKFTGSKIGAIFWQITSRVTTKNLKIRQRALFELGPFFSLVLMRKRLSSSPRFPQVVYKSSLNCTRFVPKLSEEVIPKRLPSCPFKKAVAEECPSGPKVVPKESPSNVLMIQYF